MEAMSMRRFFEEHKVFVRTFAFGMAVLLFIFSLPLSSSAVEESSYEQQNPGVEFFEAPVVSQLTQAGLVADGVSLVYDENGIIPVGTTSDYPVVAVYVGTPNSCYIYFASTGPLESLAGFAYYYSSTFNPSIVRLCSSQITFTSDYGDIYWCYGYGSFEIPLASRAAPSFASEQEAKLACADYLLNGSSGGGEEPSTRFEFDYDLPPGNVLYVRKGTNPSDWGWDLTLSADFPALSDIGSNHFVRSFYVGDAETIPSADTVFPGDLGNLLSEVTLNVAGERNAFGQSHHGELHSAEAASIYPYMVIYNPVRTGVYDPSIGTNTNMYANVTLHVHLESAVSAYAWPLTSNYTIAGGISGDIGAEPSQYDITYNDQTSTWDTTDPDGNVGVLIPGGNTLIDTSSTSIKGILQDFLSKFTGLFEKSYNAISGLINSGSAFIVKLGGLFAWLPGEVYAVLSSALLLVVVVGVLKVLL